MPKKAIVEIEIRNFKAYVPDADGGRLAVMSAGTDPKLDAAFHVIEGAGFISLTPEGGLAISKKARGPGDRLQFKIRQPANCTYQANGLVVVSLGAGAKTTETPFSAFECKNGALDVYDTEQTNADWEFFVLVQQVKKNAAGKFEFTFGVVDPRIGNS